MAELRIHRNRGKVWSDFGIIGLAAACALIASASLHAQDIQPVGAWEDATSALADQPERVFETLHDLRHHPDGELHWRRRIPIDDPQGYPRIKAWDYDGDDHVFGTFRPNLIGEDVNAEWDYFNLVATDRPDYTDATYVVGRGVTVLESGFSYRRARDRDSLLEETNRTLPELLVRYGVTNELELRFRWEGYVLSDMQDGPNDMSGHIFGDTDLTFSAKYEILQQDDWRPMITAVGGISVPSGAPEISANVVQPYLNLVAGWGIRRWVYLKLGGSVESRRTGALALQGAAGQPIAPIVVAGRDSQTVFSSSLSLQFQVSKRIGGYTEFFGFTQTGSADNRGSTYFDTGACYYFTPNIQVDAYYGIRLSGRVNESFVGSGLSTRW